ncbi:TolC family protein [Nitrosophilus alvini]|uniref:TolC family protein n=1 Tax=Nitrosophilus alvini TaxID=2714855 RepID=UPI00190A5643|nr:TolC family protein [Nitrosophilus alvini]
MKKTVFMLLPIILFGGSFEDIAKRVDENLLLKSKQQQVAAMKKMVEVAKSKNFPTVDASLQYIRLKDTPTTSLHLPLPGMPPSIPMGTKDNFEGQIGFSYPIFTGFAITRAIEKSKLEYIKARLELKDLKRNLYIKLTDIYAAVYSLNENIKALKEGLKAAKDAYKKAKGFYDQGLLAAADLYNIEAKIYEIRADIENIKSQKTEFINMLEYITGIKKDADNLPQITVSADKRALFKEALSKREDILALKKELEISQKDIELAASGYYPKIVALGALKRQGNTVALDGNGFTNADQSFIGAVIKWNIFDGYATTRSKEAASAKKLAAAYFYSDYVKKVETEIENSIVRIESLSATKEAAVKQLRAQKEYYRLTKGKFNNQLASADELSRSIAALSEAKARLKTVESMLFRQKCRLLLQISMKKFEEAVFR